MFQNAPNRPQISTAEQVQMVEQVVEIIQITTPRIVWLKRADLPIGIVEPSVETAEQLRHGQIRFRVSDIHRRVDEPRAAVSARDVVAAPQIAVKQGGLFRFNQAVIQVMRVRSGLKAYRCLLSVRTMASSCSLSKG